MTNLQPAFGVAQLERIGDFLKRRAGNMNWYKVGITTNLSVRLYRVQSWASSSYRMICLDVDCWDEFRCNS
jgi:dTDP-4-amino-4,6-dideoxygalactose transaminase